MCLYGTFVQPIFTAAAAGVLCNPLFLGPSCFASYVLHMKYYVLFKGAQAHVQNIYLKPSGKEVIMETRDGETLKVSNEKFFEPTPIRGRWHQRLDFGYGANNYVYISGNPLIFDQFVLQAVLNGQFVDT